MVVAPAVAAAEKGFSRILCRHQAGLKARAIAEGVAERVAVRITQIPLAVAPSLVERHRHLPHHGVAALLEERADGRKTRCRSVVVERDEVGKQRAAHRVQRLDERQLAYRPHPVALVPVHDQLLNLPVGEKGNALQVLAGGLIEDYRLLGQLREQLIGILIELLGVVAFLHKLGVKRFPSRVGRLCRNGEYRQKQQDDGKKWSHDGLVFSWHKNKLII